MSYTLRLHNRLWAIRSLLLVLSLCLGQAVFSQKPTPPASGGPAFDPAKTNVGRFYGKVVDENGKGVGYATVRLYGMKFDPQTRTASEALLSGQLTAENGDFNLEKLPVVGEFTLNISFIGYAELSKKVTFGVKPPTGGMPPAGTQPGTPPAGGGMGGGFQLGQFEKDLGNIALKATSTTLSEVTVKAEASVATLALDKKVYRVDKDASAVGGNAQDALKNVPSLSVDVDGNVSLRNGAPQIFVDGRPTTLSLDQIPADAIESVEVITNPSAKYDAGGGTAGIINIVLKKERRLGYNGNVRTGVDSRQGFNFGGDLNARGEKVNLFLSGQLNRMKGIHEGETMRQNLFGDPFTNISQMTNGGMQGFNVNVRTGVDWLIDNRNTLTFSGNLHKGQFNPFDNITTQTDSLFVGREAFSVYTRHSDQSRNFRNFGTSLQFKHLFPKQGAEWTADLNYNRVRFLGNSTYMTEFESGINSQERQEGRGRGQFVTFQSDLVYPLENQWKIETGVRAAMRRNRNDNSNARFDPADGEWVPSFSLTDHYKFSDDVYAAYGTLSRQQAKWSYQVGLRAESSIYSGALTDRDSSFTIAYPISLFPSAFLTRKLAENSQLQLAYTRRVNRPNFFQTMPFVDFSDSLNLRRGNPQLRPEFMNAVELSYQKTFTKGHSLLTSLYYKQATNLITSFLTTEYNADLNREIVLTTFANADNSRAYGAEFTLKNTFFKWLDLTSNANLFYTEVNADNVEQGLQVSRLSGFFKEVLQVRLAQGWSFQLNGEYRTRASFTPSNNNDPFRGGPGGGGPQNSAQGYSISNWYVDASIRKDVWGKKGTITLSASDLFKTRRNGAHSSADLFLQDSWTVRNPQLVRLNFSYRFGRMDSSLFRRKNNSVNMQGSDMMGG